MSMLEHSQELVQLVFYQPEHYKDLELFYLPDEQKQFTGMPNEMIKLAAVDQHRHPVVILAGNRPVGFFILYDGEERMDYSDNPNSLLLRAFSINYADQGKGYAKKGLSQLKEFVQANFPHVEEIVLAVNMRNRAAREVYLKCGFLDHGRTKIGPIGPQHILVLPLRDR